MLAMQKAPLPSLGSGSTRSALSIFYSQIMMLQLGFSKIPVAFVWAHVTLVTLVKIQSASLHNTPPNTQTQSPEHKS